MRLCEQHLETVAVLNEVQRDIEKQDTGELPADLMILNEKLLTMTKTLDKD